MKSNIEQMREKEWGQECHHNRSGSQPRPQTRHRIIQVGGKRKAALDSDKA